MKNSTPISDQKISSKHQKKKKHSSRTSSEHSDPTEPRAQCQSTPECLPPWTAMPGPSSMCPLPNEPQKLRPCHGPGYAVFAWCLASYPTDLPTSTWPASSIQAALVTTGLWLTLVIVTRHALLVLPGSCENVQSVPCLLGCHPQLQAPCPGRDTPNSCCSLTSRGNQKGEFTKLGSNPN